MAKTEEELIMAIEAALERVRPSLAMHGGGVRIADVDAERGILSVHLEGACVGCPLATLTLKGGVEAAVLAAVPEIRSVVEADDSASHLDEDPAELVS